MPVVKPQEMPGAVKDLKPRNTPARINRLAGESSTQFWSRAEKKGVARECVSCHAVRRFSLPQCPVCKGYMHHQVEYKPPARPIEGVPDSRIITPPNQTVASNDGNFVFEGNPEFDPKAGRPDGAAVITDTRPLKDRSLADLHKFAAEREIPIPQSLQRKNASKAKVREYIEDALGGAVDFNAAKPEPEHEPLDKEGAAAAEAERRKAKQ